MQHTVAAHAGGFVVARSRGDGEWIAISDHLLHDSARREANRLNALWQAKRALELTQAQQLAAPRRAVRYFETDTFA